MKLHCNNANCQAVIIVNEATPTSRFCGGAAVRTQEMIACPTCGRVDSQWIYAEDVAPIFVGTAYQQRTAQRKWTQEN